MEEIRNQVDNDTKKKRRKKAIIIGSLAAGAALLSAPGIWVLAHKPCEGNHTWRSTHRADGKPKVAYDTSQRANWQVVVQRVRYGENCVSYQEGKHYYTGHKYNR